jgi:predicted nucleic acid-binding protein
VSGIVYDAGALIAAERNDRALWADHRVRLEQGTIPVTPAPVVAQVSRSPRQAQLRRLLRGCDVAELDEDTAHRVGRILAQACASDIVDGAVVAAAVARSAAVVTSDRADIAHLLQSTGIDLPVIDV